MQGGGRNRGKYIALLLVGICVCALAVWGLSSLRKADSSRDDIQEKHESGADVEAEGYEDPKDVSEDTQDTSEDPKDAKASEEESVASGPEKPEDQDQDQGQELSVLVVLWDGEAEDYENRTYDSSGKFLEDFGFADMKPYYEYADTEQRPVLELYFDEETGQGCGLYHDYGYIYESGEVVYHYGFAFQHMTTEEWVPEDTYSTLSAFGDDAKELDLPQYQESYEYTDDGKLSFFEARGIIPDLGDGDIEDMVLSMNYTYRDDGTLAYKEYHHHGLIFGTWMQSMRSWYDQMERLVYRRSYITHGSVVYFYIYGDDGEKPTYLLVLDNYTDSVWPEMIKFE